MLDRAARLASPERSAFDFQRFAFAADNGALDAVNAAVGFLLADQAVHQLLRLCLVASQIEGVGGQCHHIIVLAGCGGGLERIQFRFQVGSRLP